MPEWSPQREIELAVAIPQAPLLTENLAVQVEAAVCVGAAHPCLSHPVRPRRKALEAPGDRGGSVSLAVHPVRERVHVARGGL